MCYAALLAAMYLPLSLYAAVQVGNVRISFGSLPVVAAALLFGPVDAVIVAMVGEFYKQLLTYGITYTTVLYLIPPALQGLVVGISLLALAAVLRNRRAFLLLPSLMIYGYGFYKNVAAPGNMKRGVSYQGWGLDPISAIGSSFLEAFRYFGRFRRRKTGRVRNFGRRRVRGRKFVERTARKRAYPALYARGNGQKGSRQAGG